jgi:hypothetical protein
VVVHNAFEYTQVLYLSSRRVGDHGGTWVVTIYTGEVPEYIGAGDCISLSTVEG